MKLNFVFLTAAILSLFLAQKAFSQPVYIKPIPPFAKIKSSISSTGHDTGEQIAKAKNLFEKGKNKEAMSSLRHVLMNEPMNSEAYFLLGKINYRRKKLDRAVGDFKTALFWNDDLIEAHIALSQIYFKRGDCLQANNYLQSASKLDAGNQEVLALQQQIGQCRQ